MREIIKIPNNNTLPEKGKILINQGISLENKLPEKVNILLETAMEIYLKFSQPISVISDISISEFNTVYKGEGLNEDDTPVDNIFRKADDLSLFALTIGKSISNKINDLFKKNEFAMGSMLDSVASAGADKAAEIIENHFFKILSERGNITPSTGILRYSPGYCGWHISGQKKLFSFLHPEEIGIKLLESFLMYPLKSISGVLISGKREIHNIKDTYPFCSQCKTHSCRKRIKTLLSKTGESNMKGGS